jgi:hypothetical protein
MAWSKPRLKTPKIQRIFGDPRIVMAAEGKGKRKSSPRGFYSRALDEAEKLELEEASHVEGIDEEIALLRVKLRELLEEQPERIDLHFEAANIIARLVRTRYQITKEQKKSLKEAIQKVLAEVAVPLGVGIGIKAASS